ncbi:MAG: TcpQ domain-containing protein [Desulfovibrionaceae bacterium]|nr:TcpQ domain-containing protein [Desulfovibrionaceae bacterium]
MKRIFHKSIFGVSVSLCFVALVVCTGCTAIGGKGAYDGVSGSHPGAIEPIARDAARLMAGFYPPGRTSLHVDGKTQFGRAFDGALRQRGFTLSESGIPVSYQLDMLEPGLCYLSIKTPDNQVVTQSYSLSSGGLPYSPVTTTGGTGFVEPADTAAERDISEPGPVPSNSHGVQLVLVKPAAESLQSGVTRNVTLALLGSNAVMPGADIRFRKSDAYPNLRTVDRTMNASGQLTLRGLVIRDINEPLRATVNGSQDVELYLKGRPAPKPSSAAPLARNAQQPLPPAPAKPREEFNAILDELDAAEPAESVQVLAPPAANADTPKENAFIETDLAHVPVKIDQTWEIRPGLLRGQLIGWAGQAGYQVVWKASSDYEIFTRASFKGSFENAVDHLFQRLYAHGNSLRVEIYTGNKVIEVNED